ncbi:hypothetical protein TPR58_21755 [Sphingomonas sp. HF-S3]|uniref:Response regulatory domain-containing protein n=1 Tax=Sphingomonas rustica TaxID=3103142 RepID=A0ABV0BEY4_9SPHN
MLLVLIVQDNGQQSGLVARMSLLGAKLITAHDLDSPVLTRSVRTPAVLVLDHDWASAQDPVRLDRLLDQPHWGKLVLLIGPEGCADRDPRFIYLDRRTAHDEIMAAMPAWKAELALR